MSEGFEVDVELRSARCDGVAVGAKTMSGGVTSLIDRGSGYMMLPMIAANLIHKFRFALAPKLEGLTPAATRFQTAPEKNSIPATRTVFMPIPRIASAPRDRRKSTTRVLDGILGSGLPSRPPATLGRNAIVCRHIVVELHRPCVVVATTPGLA